MRRLYYIKPNIQHFFTIAFTLLVAAELVLFVVILSLTQRLHLNLSQDLVLYIRFGSMLLLILGFSAINFWFGTRFSHRIVGPLVQIQRVLDDSGRGEFDTRIKLRSTDFLHDLADSINLTLDALHKARKAVNIPAPSNANNGIKVEEGVRY